MDVWPEFLRISWGREFLAGSIGGTAGVLTGYPLDTLRIWQQHSSKESAFAILHHEGPFALFCGMFAPLASISFQNAIVFQSYATLSRAFDTNITTVEPPSYKGVALGGIGAGAIQSLVITPIELIKIRLQLQRKTENNINQSGLLDVTRNILKKQGWRGMYHGLCITLLRDTPSHGVYFWTYEFAREQIHPGCRKNGQESFATMLFSGGLAGVTSWISCYPFDVLKTRIQAQSKYCGVFDSFKRCVEQDGYCVLWRGIWMTLSRAFIVNGAVFMSYEGAMRFISNNNDDI
ncbi:Mitochondrial arginine transporter BAC2 [Striga hermonthica]|uniref:Mitochondrial arginine transporter BAC2 n=1 Tax=Striga hermonthica TaxID=68872 RepID=A0A9N7RP73_STRHE|nr:Mitochondrial arginine transporter BAC2 [Striga hermonthica]